jgi:hypothetical protein
VAISNELAYAPIEELFLDPTNPRLGRRQADRDLSQEDVMSRMRGWNLEELAASFVQNGFWPQEAVIVCREDLYGETRLVVVEGNRRIAALKALRSAHDSGDATAPLAELASQQIPAGLFDRVPYLLVESRTDVDFYLGFRHVTGIKEWKPAEKAQYIAYLIDERGNDFRAVQRAIGSRIDTVRRNYLAFQILLQIDALAAVPPEAVEARFSVMYLALRESAVRDFIGVAVPDLPDQLPSPPVPEAKVRDLGYFALWLFGTDKLPPLFSDSRRVGEFARVLASDDALNYLRSSRRPDFEVAVRRAGADLEELLEHVREAIDQTELALTTVHLHRADPDLEELVDRFEKSSSELVERFRKAD